LRTCSDPCHSSPQHQLTCARQHRVLKLLRTVAAGARPRGSRHTNTVGMNPYLEPVRSFVYYAVYAGYTLLTWILYPLKPVWYLLYVFALPFIYIGQFFSAAVTWPARQFPASTVEVRIIPSRAQHPLGEEIIGILSLISKLIPFSSLLFCISTMLNIMITHIPPKSD
jgi:hypothetical protein